MEEHQIDIATVLSKLNNTYDEVQHIERFVGIRFIDRNGLKHEVDECRKNVKAPQLKQRESVKRGKAEINLQRNGIIMLKAKDANHPITPKVAMIYGFRDNQSSTWLNVFH